MEKERKLIIPSKNEVVKNRDFGKVRGSLTRHQRVAFASFIKNSYSQMVKSGNAEQRLFTVPLSQFREELGISHRNIFCDMEDEGKEYSLETQLKSLMDKKLEWRYKDENGKTLNVKHSVMLSDFEINREAGTLTYGLGTFLQDKVLCYGNAYISDMPLIASFRSGYAVALHDQLEQRKQFGKWNVTIEEFRVLVGLIDEYKAVFDLKKRVINPAVTEIAKICKDYKNLKAEYEKSGKTITKILFVWAVKKVNDELDETETDCDFGDENSNSDLELENQLLEFFFERKTPIRFDNKNYNLNEFINDEARKGKLNITLVGIEKQETLTHYLNYKSRDKFKKEFIIPNHLAYKIWFENERLKETSSGSLI